ncbi:MAG: pentapeptide repeat-containing protein [Clostridium sp.]|nr:pentapeptide repeat-containing protein [Clostridium sp.]
MTYINFKEEVYVAKTQLKHRNDNNSMLIAEMMHKKEKLKGEYDEKYSFKEIKNKVINNAKIQKENEFIDIEDVKIACAHFIGCKFYNMRFLNCTFIGCIFDNCDFGGGGVVFENCTFVRVESEKTPSLNINDNLSCTFNNCMLYVKFLSSDISYVIFENSHINNTNFELTDSTCMIIVNSEMKKINIVDSDLSGVKIFDTYLEDLEFNDKMQSKLDAKSFVGKIKLRKKTKAEYEGVYMVYQNLANKFHDNNLRNNFGEYYYLGRCTQRKSLDILPRIASTIDFITSGYGERIFTPLIISFVLSCIFAVIYLFTGLIQDGRIIKYGISTIFNSDFRQLLTDLNVSFKVSVGVFSGAGEDIAQTTGQSYMLSNIETAIGLTMIGIGIGTLTRKIVR